MYWKLVSVFVECDILSLYICGVEWVEGIGLLVSIGVQHPQSGLALDDIIMPSQSIALAERCLLGFSLVAYFPIEHTPPIYPTTNQKTP